MCTHVNVCFCYGLLACCFVTASLHVHDLEFVYGRKCSDISKKCIVHAVHNTEIGNYYFPQDLLRRGCDTFRIWRRYCTMIKVLDMDKNELSNKFSYLLPG